LDVAAKGDRRKHVFGAVAPAPRPQRPAEADREAQHFDPVAARDPVVAELVEGDQQPKADDEPPQGSNEGAHAGGLMGRSGGWSVAWPSRARGRRLRVARPARAQALPAAPPACPRPGREWTGNRSVPEETMKPPLRWPR